ncbi:hypothetical protein BHE74_00043724 [Ensete ventricosum]|nr:hypothetical protein BHE74_00043724 [Ensete ventricosum]
MRLGTRQECVGSSPRVLGVCQDGIREFAKRRSRLVGRLSRVAKMLDGRLPMTRAMKLQPDDGLRSNLSIGPGFERCSGISSEFARKFAEGIGKFTCRRLPEEDHRTRCKNVGWQEYFRQLTCPGQRVNRPYPDFSDTIEFCLQF